MSLFGESPENSPIASRSRQSLFDDEPTPGASQSSLFADDDGPGDSPWGIPSAKKAGRSELVKNLLQNVEVPEQYVDIYDNLMESGGRVGAGIGLTGVKRVLEASRLDPEEQAQILNIIIPGGQETAAGLGRGEFNVLLALIGLAQEGEDATLDGVDERRKRLPKPSLPSLANKPPPAIERREPPPATPTSRNMNSESLDESDPWASPAVHKGHDHSKTDLQQPKTNGSTGSSNSSEVRGRTTSTYTTQSDLASTTSTVNPPPGQSDGSTGGWGSYGSAAANGFSGNEPAGLGPEVFGTPSTNAETPQRAIGGGRVTGSGIEEVVTVTVLPEKEGVFMFQHRNYQVASVRRGSTVVRRYSDFTWLLDCLHKKYPFRALPLLPPKRVAVNGRHLSADIGFIEKRRRGLARFMNALVRHPVLSQEQLVVMFLTVPTELSVWRKQATISVQEEFTGKPLPPTLEDSLPPSLNEMFDTVRSGVRRSAELYVNLCSLMDRLIKRNEGVAADYLRFSLALQSLTESSESTYNIDTNDVPLLNEGLKSTAKHLSTSQSLLEDEARTWDEGVMEDLKRQRDTLVSVRDMFDRRDRYARDNIPQLEKRIASNENKLAGMRARPDGTLKPGEIEKVEEAIIKDKQSIVDQHARGVFIRECIRDELNYFQSSQYHVTRLHQDWAQERTKYAELQAENWRALGEEVEGMPLGD